MMEEVKMERISVCTEEIKQTAQQLRAGDTVYLSGTIYTARDAAHKRLNEMLDRGEQLPVSPGERSRLLCRPYSGACRPAGRFVRPTTSSRMDVFTPRFLDLGLKAMIGKGDRSAAVKDAICRNNAVYFCAVGGAGALAAQSIRSLRVVAFEDLGCESVKELRVEKFPLIVGIDCQGGTLFR